MTIPNLRKFTQNGFPSVSGAMTGLIQGPDGLTGTAATDADNGSLEILGLPRPPAVLALGAANGVTYEARIFDEDDPARSGTTLTGADITRIGEDGDPTTDANATLVIQAIGYAANATMVTLEATMASATGNLPALAVGGDLVISGDPTITGSQGGVHADDRGHVGRRAHPVDHPTRSRHRQHRERGLHPWRRERSGARSIGAGARPPTTAG